MAQKGSNIKVELDVQAVTCPGTWLSSDGEVSLQLYMLDSCVETSSYRPTFPMQCREQFSFTKTLPDKYVRDDLPKLLGKEWIYMELIQWKSFNSGNVLAYFQTPLKEILYPKDQIGSNANGEVDLFMKPTSLFPGALAPKVEVCARTILEQTSGSCGDEEVTAGNTIAYPNVVECPGPTAPVCPGKQPTKGKRKKCAKACKYRATCDRPPFRYHRVSDHFLARQRVMDLETKYEEPARLNGASSKYCTTCCRPRTKQNEDEDPQPKKRGKSKKSGSKNSKCVKTCNFRDACDKPPFRYKKVEDKFLARERVFDFPASKFTEEASPFDRTLDFMKKNQAGTEPENPCPNDNKIDCGCNGAGSSHAAEFCTVCTKYSGLFKDPKPQNKQECYPSPPMIPDSDILPVVCQSKDKPCRCTPSNLIKHPCVTPEIKSTAKKLHERVSRSLQGITFKGDYEAEAEADVFGDEKCKLPNLCRFYKHISDEE